MSMGVGPMPLSQYPGQVDPGLLGGKQNVGDGEYGVADR